MHGAIPFVLHSAAAQAVGAEVQRRVDRPGGSHDGLRRGGVRAGGGPGHIIPLTDTMSSNIALIV